MGWKYPKIECLAIAGNEENARLITSLSRTVPAMSLVAVYTGETDFLPHLESSDIDLIFWWKTDPGPHTVTVPDWLRTGQMLVVIGGQPAGSERVSDPRIVEWRITSGYTTSFLNIIRRVKNQLKKKYSLVKETLPHEHRPKKCAFTNNAK
ncbi:hypothetical protein LT679_00255 [Mucilaginibacter roseus]|uniref:Uncharacterized protein n=1 Tax=Mucilaginibacter roseus TaxID=1528868 RepID=A0ABS8TVW3_9SPHI|nr:hypothetical protein [Mucilaginibacter roseus]MCD8739016.1 hypothetical protein [Mucilaginibacter roseus]